MESTNVPHTQKPEHHVTTLDDFKTNCLLLEDNLTRDHQDPREDITKLCTWIDWLQRGEGTPEHRSFFLNESLPKIIRGMLTRKYLSEISHTDAACNLFKLVCGIITSEFMADYDGLQLLLCDLFDPNKHFYTKYGFPKPQAPPTPTTVEATPFQAWKTQLECGSCFDAKDAVGQWQFVVVEAISPTYTEVNVAWPNGTTEWMSLEDDTRVAAFGTKTGFAEAQPENPSAATEEVSDVIEVVPVAPIDDQWREAIGVGYLLDCKDGGSAWFQSVVMEMRSSEAQVKVSPVPEQPVDADSQPPMELETQEEYLTTLVTEARIAYLGWPEKYDEWVDVTSDRLAPLDTRSYGRRGEFSIRNEIKFLIPRPDTSADVHFAAYSSPYFYSKYYVEVVQYFGLLQGFDVVWKRILQGQTPLPVVTRLRLLEALGLPHEVYSMAFLTRFIDSFKQITVTTLVSLPQQALRSISRDLMEGVLKSLERMLIAALGRNSQAGFAYELASVALARNCLNCPFLNRRLDGLKLISDVVTRVTNAQLYPSGLKITKKTNSQGAETGISYEVVPVALFYSAETLTEWIASNDIVAPLFRGERAHTSLMERSVEVLKFLAVNGRLAYELVQLIWEVGTSGEKEALTALQETIQSMNLELLGHLCGAVANVSTVTTDVVDIISGIGRRTRAILLQLDSDDDADHTHAAQLHNRTLSDLCFYSDEQSQLADGVVARCVSALEELCGFPAGESVIEGHKWAAQWVRTLPLVEWAAKCFAEGRNVVTSLRILQMLISVWPKGNQRRADATVVAELNLADARVPFNEGTRSSVSEYLEQQFGIISRVVADLIRLKATFAAATAEIVAEALPQDANLANSPSLLADDVQTVLNDYLLSGSRLGYLEQMQKRLDFLQFFVRSSDQLVLSQQTIQEVWDNAVLHCVTKKERDMLFGWLGRIAVKVTKSAANSNDGEDDTNRIIVCTADTVDWIFQQLLSNPQFISSVHFSDSALGCVDRYFRHINARKDRLMEVGSLSKQYKITSTDLEGVDVFWLIMQTAVDDTVANRAAKIITALPSKLSPQLLEAGKLPEFRLDILHSCMQLLRASTGSENVSRLLLLLNTLLDESAADGRGKLRTHGGNSRGAALRLRVNCSGKIRKLEDPYITVYANDSGEEMLGTIASAVGQRPAEIKVYRSGKELTMDDRKRSLKELGVNNGEAVMVASRAPAAASTTNKSDTKTDDEDPIIEVPIDSLPAYVLSSSQEYFHELFDLLETSKGSVCDMVWKILMRLPTNPRLHTGWLELADDPSSLLLMTSGGETVSDETIANISLPKLLYTLQILEGLIQPAETMDELQEIAGENAFLLDWPFRFIARGGVQLLCQLLTTQALLKSDVIEVLDQQQPGVTRGLLLQTLKLLLKMVYACIRQASQAQLGDNVSESAALVSAEMVRRVTEKSQSVNLLEVADGRPVPPPLPPAAIDLTSTDAQSPTASSQPDASTDAAPPKVVAEWGWRLVFQQTDAAEIFATIDLSRMQERVLDLMALMRGMAPVLKEWVAPASIILGYKLPELQITLLEPLDCLLGISCTLLVVDPQLATRFGYVDVNDQLVTWLSHALLPQLPEQPVKPTLSTLGPAKAEKLDPDEITGRWLKDALLFIVKMTEASNDQKSSDELSLTVRILRSLFQIRPSTSIVASGIDADLPSSASVSTFFELLKQLVVSAHHVLSADERTDIVKSLLTEISALNSHSNLAEFFGAREEILAGNLHLLAGLIFVDSMVSKVVIGEEFHIVLLSRFLGVFFPEAGSDTEALLEHTDTAIICKSDRSQEAAYDVLLALASQNSDLARVMFEFISLAHKVVPLPEGWAYKPDMDFRSPLGFVGLRNLGCTCYMNSLLQQLYMIPAFRSGVLAVPQLTYEDNEQKDDIVRHLQHMFASLSFSERKAYRPTGWAYAFKDETGTKPINPALQQDAQEFFSVLCDRLEFGLKGTPQATITNNAMEGRIMNQILKDGNDTDVRESEEPFYCLSLRVEGIANVEASLRNFVEGELITDYGWDDAGLERVNIVRRQCISALPQTLMFHLKRFELNFDTFMREKINAEFKFPFTLNMFPYTKQGLAAQHRGIVDPTAQDDQYSYVLVGIVVHSGSADMGHYYSLIRDRGALDKWIEFNDSEIKPFNESQIPTECFGGKRTIHEFNATTKTWGSSEVTNSKSAYMLVYERADTLNVPQQSTELSLVSESFIKEVTSDNRIHRLSARVFTKAHMCFISKLLPVMNFDATLNSTDESHALELLQQACEFVLGLLSRSCSFGAFKDACKELGRVHAGHLHAARQLLKRLSSNFKHIQELIMAPEERVREGTCMFLWEVIRVASAADGVRLLENDLLLSTGTMTDIKAQNDKEEEQHKQKRQKQENLPQQAAAESNDGSEQIGMEVVVQEDDNSKSWVATFLADLTSDRMFATVAEQWRRSYQLTVLLLKWAQDSWVHRHFLIKREAILEICDLILGDSSPACGVLYIKGVRKRAPASYVTVPLSMTGKTPSSEWQPRLLINMGSSATTLQNTPDWTCLVEILSLLIRSSKSKSMLDMKGIPETLLNSDDSAPTLDDWSSKCLKTKTLYTTLLKQARYTPSVIEIVTHTCHEWVQFTNDSADVLLDALSLTNMEGTAHIFQAIDAFLFIRDDLDRHRALRLFSSTENILNYLGTQQDVNPKFVCVCLRSVVALLERHMTVRTAIGGNELPIWAPWVLKFVYQFKEKAVRDEQAAATVVGAYSSVTGDTQATEEEPKGPKITVFGESEQEAELRWSVRAQNLFDSLQTMIRQLGGDPDSLIPADAFVVETAASAAVSAAGGATDAMDDEAFARQLQQMDDIGMDIPLD